MELEKLVQALTGSNDQYAYACLKELLAQSENSDAVFAYFDQFAAMVTSQNSYQRTRGLLLIAANAQWDTEGKVEEVLPEYLRHITDEKPITSRQCIRALPQLVAAQPSLAFAVLQALQTAKPQYADTMQGLVQRDIAAAVKAITARGGA